MSIINVTTENFQSEVLESKETVILDFHATWCSHCVVLNPILEEIVADGVPVKICKVDVDQAPSLAQQYKIEYVPTVFIVKDGVLGSKTIAPKSKEVLVELAK